VEGDGRDGRDDTCTTFTEDPDQEPPPWVKENRMWTHEEAEKWKKDYEELGKENTN
jgi:hypothetical protein